MPSRFRELAPEDQADILAHDAALGLMRRVEDAEMTGEMERQRKELLRNG